MDLHASGGASLIPLQCRPLLLMHRLCLRPPDDGGDDGVLLLSRLLRRFARGQALLGRARPMEQIEILARERPLFFGMPSGVFSKLRDDGFELRDTRVRSLPGPGAAAAAAISSRISRWVV